MSISIHFHDVQWSAILSIENTTLRIYASGSVHENCDVGTGPNLLSVLNGEEKSENRLEKLQVKLANKRS